MKLLIAISFLTTIVVVVFLNSIHESTDSALQKASSPVRYEYIDNPLPTEEKSVPQSPKTETVIASFYGGERNDFHGKTMANGERFNKNDPTIAASNELPLGTEIQVTNVENGKSAILTVKDRGGFEKYGRELDVSRAAAQKLGFIEEGLAQVKILIIKWPKA